MKNLSLHISNWQIERGNTLSIGYCFSAVNNNAQDKPRITQGICNDGLDG